MAEMDDANETYAHFHAGERLLTGGNVAQAIVRLEKARRLDPEKSSIRESLGRAYYARRPLVGRRSGVPSHHRAISDR